MILSEPPQTQYDLRFRIFGIPVRIHPYFWLATLMLGYQGSGTPPINMLIWVGVVFVSILIHELGHALVAWLYGWPPWITLYAFGGLASYRPTYRTARSEILISLAGPGAGFLFIALIMALVHASGHYVTIDTGGMLTQWVKYSPPFDSANVNIMIRQLLFLNIFWGLVNLLPIFPLDGGHIAQELMTQANPRDGLQKSLWLSVFTAAAVAILLGVRFNDIYVAVFFGYLAYTSFSTLQQLQGRGGHGRPW
ncbi:MAG: site-2 protease family protein [Planctomycetes bacterium]|nr:site-2 protease family protein [Planctomycetota bacterium]